MTCFGVPFRFHIRGLSRKHSNPAVFLVVTDGLLNKARKLRRNSPFPVQGVGAAPTPHRGRTRGRTGRGTKPGAYGRTRAGFHHHSRHEHCAWHWTRAGYCLDYWPGVVDAPPLDEDRGCEARAQTATVPQQGGWVVFWGGCAQAGRCFHAQFYTRGTGWTPPEDQTATPRRTATG